MMSFGPARYFLLNENICCVAGKLEGAKKKDTSGQLQMCLA